MKVSANNSERKQYAQSKSFIYEEHLKPIRKQEVMKRERWPKIDRKIYIEIRTTKKTKKINTGEENEKRN